MRNNIKESVSAHDLHSMVHNIISVDEYQPKLNEDNIVVCIQVKDCYDAAYDLSSFLEKSPNDILDTEAPEPQNMDGRYNVFVEFSRDAAFPKKLQDLITDLERISNKEKWKIQAYKINDPFDYDPAIVDEVIRVVPKDTLKEFFEPSLMRVSHRDMYIIISESIPNGNMYVYESAIPVSEDEVKIIIESGNYSGDESSFERSLGPTYTVIKAYGGYLVGNGSEYLLLK